MPAPLSFLVVDDDADIRFITRRALERAFANCLVSECAAVAEALEAAERTPFDAILTDHQLGGPDGSAFIAALRETGVVCPILMITGNSDPRVHAQAYESGANQVFHGDYKTFLPYLREVLERSSKPRGDRPGTPSPKQG